MKEKKYALYGIGVVLISLIGISLAYFATQIVGKEKDISVNTKDLRIIFNNGDAITGENVVAEDNWSMTKTFSVENKSNSTYKYNIVIKDLINTFKTTGYLQYKITSTDSGYNMTSFEDVPKSSKAQDTVLAYSISIAEGVTQNYTITIQYPNDENIDQSDDMGAELSGKLYISEGSYPSLAKLILIDNPTISERTDFSVTNTATTTGTIYQTNKTEDGSTVYYYSGNTANNWVKFGKETITECTYNSEPVLYAVLNDAETDYMYARTVRTSEECNSTKVCTLSYNIVGLSESLCTEINGTWSNVDATLGKTTSNDIYWRIIRTNEDGSTRLLYSGISPDTTKAYISMDYSETSRNAVLRIGYMYGTRGSFEQGRENKYSSVSKKIIDNWYENNLLTNYYKYLSKTAIYCNDRSTTNNYTDLTIKYGATSRLEVNNSPSYKCGVDKNSNLIESTQAIADKFSVSTEGGGNGQLTYPIAMMTADELVFAGGVSGTEAVTDNKMVWYYLNSNNESVTSNLNIRTMTPFLTTNSNVYFYSLLDSYRLTGWSSGELRPVISLSSCVGIKSGYGTPESPYEVDYDGSCK